MTRLEALQHVAEQLALADQALQADPSSDLCFRHRENAKGWLAVAVQLGEIEAVAPPGFGDFMQSIIGVPGPVEVTRFPGTDALGDEATG